MKIFKKNIWAPLAISAVVALFFILLTIFPTDAVHFLEVKSYDWKFHLRGKRDIGKEVVIVGIDEKSITTVGRWPWSREVTASLIGKVAQQKPKVIGIDIIFSEPQKSEGMAVISEIKSKYKQPDSQENELLKFLKNKEKSLDADKALLNSIKDAGNIVLPLVFMVSSEEGEKIEKGAAVSYILRSSFYSTQKSPYFAGIEADSVLPPLRGFADAANSMGHIYTTYEKDGVIRWETLSIKYKKSYYPSFGLEIARIYAGIEKENVKLYIGNGIEFGEDFMETDEGGRMLVNYGGPAGTFPTYSAVDVMEGKVGKDVFKDKAVLIATTAIGTYDIHVTPYANMPGTEKNAAVIDNIINKSYLKRVESQILISVGVIIFFALLAGILTPRLKAVNSGLFAIGLIIICMAASYYAFAYRNLWLDFITPVGSVFITFAVLTSYKYMTEEKKAKEIRNIFSSYVTEKVVNELIKNPEMAKLGGQRTDVTVLFSDIRGFTTISEQHQPEEVVEVLNEYLTSMVNVVFRWEGTLDKFIGDAVMAFWGAPVHQPNHAELGVRCAIHMIAELKRLQEKWRREGKTVLNIGIGVNSGEVIVGNMGAEGKKMDYTIIGDNVNLGSRVEGLTKTYKTSIIITEFTYNKIRVLVERDKKFGHIEFKELEPVKVKGKDKPVFIYAVEMLPEDSKQS